MTRTAVSLQHSGERRGEAEEDVQDRIREMRQRWGAVLTLLTPTNMLSPLQVVCCGGAGGGW